MAIIAKQEKIPERKPYKGLPQISEDQVIHFASRTGDELIHLAPAMVLSMAATAAARKGSPIPASQLVEISQIGIFASWDWGKKLGQLSEEGFFTRTHVGTEEYFRPDKKFDEYVKETHFDVREPIT
jgi:hypothetical protein